MSNDYRPLNFGADIASIMRVARIAQTLIHAGRMEQISKFMSGVISLVMTVEWKDTPSAPAREPAGRKRIAEDEASINTV